MISLVEGVAHYAAEIATLTASHGHAVSIDPRAVLDRSDVIGLSPPGETSPNGSCRLARAQDGWIAVNLPRPSDLDLVPAWLGQSADGWAQIAASVAKRPWRTLVDQAALLGLAVTGVGETATRALQPSSIRYACGGARSVRLKVVDLSSLWAGPLCGAILAEMGSQVVKMESVTRPDSSRSMPAFHARMNGRKRFLSLDFADRGDVARLSRQMMRADIIITSARPRAFAQLGLGPERIFGANPGLVWIAITGHGWAGEAGHRVAFGDDAAAAGGLLNWSPADEPRFAGDALADPLTGLAAASAGLRAYADGGGVLIDTAMACIAGGVAEVFSR